jgi:hypothetical protein
MPKVEAVQTVFMTLTMKTLSIQVMKHHSRNFLNSRVAPRCSGPNTVLVKQSQYIFTVKTGCEVSHNRCSYVRCSAILKRCWLEGWFDYGVKKC